MTRRLPMGFRQSFCARHVAFLLVTCCSPSPLIAIFMRASELRSSAAAAAVQGVTLELKGTEGVAAEEAEGEEGRDLSLATTFTAQTDAGEWTRTCSSTSKSRWRRRRAAVAPGATRRLAQTKSVCHACAPPAAALGGLGRDRGGRGRRALARGHRRSAGEAGG